MSLQELLNIVRHLMWGNAHVGHMNKLHMVK